MFNKIYEEIEDIFKPIDVNDKVRMRKGAKGNLNDAIDIISNVINAYSKASNEEMFALMGDIDEAIGYIEDAAMAVNGKTQITNVSDVEVKGTVDRLLRKAVVYIDDVVEMFDENTDDVEINKYLQLIYELLHPALLMIEEEV